MVADYYGHFVVMSDALLVNERFDAVEFAAVAIADVAFAVALEYYFDSAVVAVVQLPNSVIDSVG